MRGDEVEGLERKINLLRYITPVSKQNKDIRAVLASETVEMQALWAALCEVFDNQFFRYMGDYGLSKWEAVFDILPRSSESIEMRRARILTLLKGRRPYTLKKFQEILDSVYGRGTITLELKPNEYELWLNFDSQYTYKRSDAPYLLDTVETIVPKNLIVIHKIPQKVSVENHVAMLKSTVKTVDVYPAAVEQIQPESTFYVALAMTTTEELTLQIGGI